MKLSVYKSHFKTHPLMHTVTLSALLHLVALSFIPAGYSAPKPDRENLIKIRYLPKKNVSPQEKVTPVLKKIAHPKTDAPQKPTEINRPDFKAKSAIMKSVDAVSPPPHSVKRNPVPIHYSEKKVTPITTVHKYDSIAHPGADSRRMAELVNFQAIRSSPRMNHRVHKKQSTPARLTKLATGSTNTLIHSKPTQLVSRLTNFSEPNKEASLVSTAHANTITEVKFATFQKSNPLVSRQASFTTANKIVSLIPSVPTNKLTEMETAGFQKTTSQVIKTTLPRKFTTHRKPLPVRLAGMPKTNPPITGIKKGGRPHPATTINAMKPQALNKSVPAIRVFKQTLKTYGDDAQAKKTQAQAPKALNSETSVHYRPASPIATTHFSSPLQSINLIQATPVPTGFSEDNLKKENVVTTGASEQLVRLNNSGSDLSSQLLAQIKNGFSARVVNRIEQVKYYPRIASRRGFEGQPVVTFTLGKGGELLQLTLKTPSRFKLLNDAALDAVESARPYPEIPELLKMDSMKFNLPISFLLEDR
jgi:TonB family protein